MDGPLDGRGPVSDRQLQGRVDGQTGRLGGGALGLSGQAARPFTSSVFLGKSLHLSVPRSHLICKMGVISIFLIGLLRGQLRTEEELASVN